MTIVLKGLQQDIHPPIIVFPFSLMKYINIYLFGSWNVECPMKMIAHSTYQPAKRYSAMRERKQKDQSTFIVVWPSLPNRGVLFCATSFPTRHWPAWICTWWSSQTRPPLFSVQQQLKKKKKKNKKTNSLRGCVWVCECVCVCACWCDEKKREFAASKLSLSLSALSALSALSLSLSLLSLSKNQSFERSWGN